MVKPYVILRLEPVNIYVSPLKLRGKNPKEGAIFDHILHTGHNPSFDDFETLVKDSNELRLLLRESLLISSDESSLNKYVKSIPLELFILPSTI